MEWHIYIPFVFFLLWLLNDIRKKSGDLSKAIILMYMISALGSIALYGIFGFIYDFDIGLKAALFYVIILYLFFSPFRRFKLEKKDCVDQSNVSRKLSLISYILIPLNLLCILIFLPDTIHVVTNYKDVLDARQTLLSGEASVTLPLPQVVMSFLGLAAICYPITLFIFFYNNAYRPKRKMESFLLLLASMAFVVKSLAYTSRDGVVYWCMTYIVMYLLFKSIIPDKRKRILISPFVIIAIFGGTAFLLISIGRFMNGEAGVLARLFDYLCQPFLNFAQQYQSVDLKHYYGHLNFQFICGLFSGNTTETTMYETLIEDSNSVGFRLNVFSSFAGTFFLDFGKKGTLFLAFAMYLITSRLVRSYNRIKKKGKISIPHLFIILQIYLIYFQGLFYFRLYSNIGNIFIIICTVMFFYLSGNSKSATLKRQARSLPAADSAQQITAELT